MKTFSEEQNRAVNKAINRAVSKLVEIHYKFKTLKIVILNQFLSKI